MPAVTLPLRYAGIFHAIIDCLMLPYAMLRHFRAAARHTPPLRLLRAMMPLILMFDFLHISLPSCHADGCLLLSYFLFALIFAAITLFSATI